MPRERATPRRAFLRSAVATGGAAALSACLDRVGRPDVDRGPADPSGLPERQHAWNDALSDDEHGNVLPPRHQVLLPFDYAGEGIPSSTDREQVEAALRGLERAYERSNDGLLTSVGYSPAYFERFETDLPDSVDLPDPEALAPFEDPSFDDADGVIHLASDHPQVVLAAEEGLRGRRSTLNGVELEASLDGVCTVTDRRTGFVGSGLPADHDDATGVPEGEVPDDAPLFMGFKSGFEKNQASEDRVTIQGGPFGGGTTQHVSKLHLNLQQWYEQDDRDHRVATMFCPAHADADVVEGTGENLGNGTEIEERGCPAHVEDDAREEGVVGHSQKTARAREDGSPIILRRDFDSADGSRASLHFVSLQREIGDFVATRERMNGTPVAESGAAVGQRTDNGILQYIRVERRGNYLLPPRSRRALPPARPQ